MWVSSEIPGGLHIQAYLSDFEWFNFFLGWKQLLKQDAVLHGVLAGGHQWGRKPSWRSRVRHTSGGWERKLAQPRLPGTFQHWETPAVEDRNAQRLPAINPEWHGESQPCTLHERSANPGPQKVEIQPQVKPNACGLQLNRLLNLPQLQAVCWWYIIPPVARDWGTWLPPASILF